MPFRLIFQTDESPANADAGYAAAAEAARAAFASSIGEEAHGLLEYNVDGISPFPNIPNAGEFSAAVTVTPSGTMVAGGVGEAAIVSGGETLILTVANDVFDEDIGEDSDATTALIAGLVGDDDFATVTALMDSGDVVRTSDTVVTITLPAAAAYAIATDEDVTITVPAAALAKRVAVAASAVVTITAA